jgi:U6 snRNA-associated Sm-like protein LSm6
VALAIRHTAFSEGHFSRHSRKFPCAGPDFAASLDERPLDPIRCARARSPIRHASMSDAKSPADFLKSIKGQKVLVKLNSGVDYRGIMSSLDGYMNIAMEQTEVRGRDDLERPRGSARFGWSPPRARVGVACASRVTPRSEATREPVREPATGPRAIASSALRSRSKGTLVGFSFFHARRRALEALFRRRTTRPPTTRFMSSRVTGSIDVAQNESLRVLF